MQSSKNRPEIEILQEFLCDIQLILFYLIV